METQETYDDDVVGFTSVLLYNLDIFFSGYLWVLLLLTPAYILCDPCQESTLLADKRRSAQYVVGTLDTYMCDIGRVHTGEFFKLTTNFYCVNF